MDLPRNIGINSGYLRLQKIVNGKTYRLQTKLKPTQSGITAALAIRDDWLEAVRYGDNRPKTIQENHTFAECAELYLNKLLKEGRQRATLQGYQSSINNAWRSLHNESINLITSNDLITLDESFNHGSKRTRKNNLTALRGVFTYASSRGWIELDPANALKNAKTDRSDPDPYSQTETDLLLSHTDLGPYKDYFRLAFGTGARTGELLALTWDDWNGESLWISKSIVRGKLQQRTKTNKSRRVVVSKQLTTYLQQMPRPIHGGCIVSGSTKPITNAKPIVKEFKKAHEASGVRFRTGPYPWRHTYISSMLSIGIDLYMVAENVGDRQDTIETFYKKYLPIRDKVKIMHDAWELLEKR